MSRKVVNITEHDHWADYAELETPPNSQYHGFDAELDDWYLRNESPKRLQRVTSLWPGVVILLGCFLVGWAFWWEAMK